MKIVDLSFCSLIIQIVCVLKIHHSPASFTFLGHPWVSIILQFFLMCLLLDLALSKHMSLNNVVNAQVFNSTLVYLYNNFLHLGFIIFFIAELCFF